MNPFRDHVMGQYEVADHGDVIVQSAGSGIGGDLAKSLDEVEFAVAHCNWVRRLLNIRLL